MNELIKQIKEFKLTVTVWNNRKQRMDLVISTNKGYAERGDANWSGEIQLEGGLDGLDTSLALIEHLKKELTNVRPEVVKNEKF